LSARFGCATWAALSSSTSSTWMSARIDSSPRRPRRSAQSRSRSDQGSAIQRLWPGGDHAQTRQAVAGADAFSSLPNVPGDRHGEKLDHGVQRDLHRAAQDEKALRRRDVLLRVNPETVKVLKQNNASWLTNSRSWWARTSGEERCDAASGAIRYSGIVFWADRVRTWVPHPRRVFVVAARVDTTNLDQRGSEVNKSAAIFQQEASWIPDGMLPK